MKRPFVGILFAITLVPGPLLAQAAPAPKWEYGRLYAQHGVPLVFATGRVSVGIDSAVAVYRRALLGDAKAEVDSGVMMPWALEMTTLNKLGAEGWELVSVVRDPGEDHATEYFFKRPKAKP